VAFGSQAANTAIVAEVVGTLKSLALSGGPLLLIDGPASLPVAFVLAHATIHLYATVAVRDPKLQGFVVVASHGAHWQVGDLIPASAAD
jgi:CRISPR-associated protein Csx3